MPWCDDCAKFWNPSSMRADGSCPACHRVLATRGALRLEARMLGEDDPTTGKKSDGTPKVPWHFKLMVVALVIYLGWRLVQGIVWVADRA